MERIMGAFGDVSWIALAFLLGFLASQIGVPPLVGFLVAGFVLQPLGFSGSEALSHLSDVGITLLLFSVGLKLNLRALIKPQVWAVTILHSGGVVLIVATFALFLGVMNLPLFTDLDAEAAVLLAFAISFSSTVFAAGSLDKSGEQNAQHGSLSLGILVVQDLLAVAFLVLASGQLPQPKAALLLLLLAMRPLLLAVLQRVGHGELLVLLGMVLALGGAALFEMVGLKGDLGALALGVLVAGHPKSNELAKSMFALKEFFLIGFFLSVGLTAKITLSGVTVGILLTGFLLVKSMLFFFLMTRFGLRSRTSLLATLNLGTFSEFGLIVMAIGVGKGWIGGELLAALSIALSLSFVIASLLVRYDDRIYHRYRDFWLSFQSQTRLVKDDYLDTREATIVIFGMGRVGTGAYEMMTELHGARVLGVDFDHDRVLMHQAKNRHVVRGDPSDADFWEKVGRDHMFELIMFALPNLEAHLDALEQLRNVSFKGRVTAIAKYPDEKEALLAAGAWSVFDIYKEAGTGFAEHTELVEK